MERKRKSEKRSFEDPARRIFYELRNDVAGAKLTLSGDLLNNFIDVISNNVGSSSSTFSGSNSTVTTKLFKRRITNNKRNRRNILRGSRAKSVDPDFLGSLAATTTNLPLHSNQSQSEPSLSAVSGHLHHPNRSDTQNRLLLLSTFPSTDSECHFDFIKSHEASEEGPKMTSTPTDNNNGGNFGLNASFPPSPPSSSPPTSSLLPSNNELFSIAEEAESPLLLSVQFTESESGLLENNNETCQATKHLTIPNRNTRTPHHNNHRPRGGLAGFQTGKPKEEKKPKMDLVYATERIISLVFPVEMDEASYTLHLREVAHMLSSKHGDNFRVFDLSLSGEVSRYLPRVTPLGWAHGLSPPLERLCSICKALDSWLQENPLHVAVLHSRTGYEKLGVVMAAYMHYAEICASTDQALDRYAMKRFFDDRIGESLHPSQKRYVQYFAGLLTGAIRINSSPLYLHTLTIYGIPNFESKGGCHLFLKIYQGQTPIYTSGVYSLSDAMKQVTIAFETAVQLRGDIILKAYHRRLTPVASREVVFRVQFHTCAVSDKVLPFARHQLDDACNDLRFPLDGGIELLFSQFADDKPTAVVSTVSCDKAPCPITTWDSCEELERDTLPSAAGEQGSSPSATVSHTLGPLDGSLYATVSKRRSNPATPSPHGTNGRYAASVDSGIASSNSAGGVAPLSPPTSDTSRTSGEAAQMAPVTAHAHRQSSTTTSGKDHVDASKLDELLAGMLLDIEAIPDLRPCQAPAPDIDSIRCPKFDSEQQWKSASYQREISPPRRYGSSLSQQASFNGSDLPDQVPYHARTDSKPFSYGPVTSSSSLQHQRYPRQQHSSQSPSSRHCKESFSAGLESPRLIRRMPGTVTAGASPPVDRYGRSRSPSPDAPDGKGHELHHSITTKVLSRESSPCESRGKSPSSRCTSRLDEVDYSYHHNDSLNHTYSNGGSLSSSWLENQQRKLQERRDAKVKAVKGPQDARMFSELRSRFSQRHGGGRDCEDGYTSDTTHLSETSRETSPVKTLYPLTINTSQSNSSSYRYSERSGKGGSAPSSPVLSNRTVPSSSTMVKQMQHANSLKVSRKHSDVTHDRERPFVSVKRAHDSHRPPLGNTESSLNQLKSSPVGLINYSQYKTSPSLSSPNDGLLLTTISATSSKQDTPRHVPESLGAYFTFNSSFEHDPSNKPLHSTPNPFCFAPNPHNIKSGEDLSWQSDSEFAAGSGNRSITPAFPPATPTTPYLNQGLPPKSPTVLRKDAGALRSPSPATTAYIRPEMNGHSSPAPSLYYGHSRRSSLTSLNDSMEVISSHPKFVKDISKFWYKPSISRDDAINMLRNRDPGTFVVRDSNSFPGAFGLALKVSTPPPNVNSKSSSDPSSELVRHFLIEPTSRGVRLKGCANEPVFGSLSALVYQHSITALALPCRLVLPDSDPASSGGGAQSSTDGTPKSETLQLLQQGAACNVLYLFSVDTESLTGPQAVKRAIHLMLVGRPKPTIVHLKVSSQGITLTDNSRQLFFRRHYPVASVSHCGLDPDDRRWAHKNEQGEPIGSLRMFGFVAKKGSSRTENQCHVVAEFEPEQPATAICNFITRVMMTSVNRSNLV